MAAHARPRPDSDSRTETTGGWFARRAKELLFGTPIDLADPAKIHISQVTDEVYNPGSGMASANCGPTSVIMAIRLVGKRVPGEERGLRGEDLVMHVRRLATGGQNDRWRGTHNLHLQHVIEAADCRWETFHSVDAILRCVRTTRRPVIMAGNPANRGCYTDRYSYYDIRRSDNGHWIVVSRYNPERRTYVVNDPQSTIGPIEVTAAELVAFDRTDGGFGIAVSPR